MCQMNEPMKPFPFEWDLKHAKAGKYFVRVHSPVCSGEANQLLNIVAMNTLQNFLGPLTEESKAVMATALHGAFSHLVNCGVLVDVFGTFIVDINTLLEMKLPEGNSR